MTGKIQVLVATSTLAWGVNTPTHLVVIKGTEYYDGPTQRYVDYPITDVLQMMGRAGRPQFDQYGVAVVMVHEPKKAFYKKFLYEPFPVESSLMDQLTDHINAEIVSGQIKTHQDAIDWLTWTYFYRRLLKNPSYYGLEQPDPVALASFLSELIEETVDDLIKIGCIGSSSSADGSRSWEFTSSTTTVDTDADSDVGLVASTTRIGPSSRVTPTTRLFPLPPGQVASFYYLKYQTMGIFRDELRSGLDTLGVLDALCNALEFSELPVRHNEENLNAQLSKLVRFPRRHAPLDSTHTKAHLLLQAHIGRVPLPMADFETDLRGVLDNAMRLLQAMLDISAAAGWLKTSVSCMYLIQSLTQAAWPDLPGSSLEQLPHLVRRKARSGGASYASENDTNRHDDEDDDDHHGNDHGDEGHEVIEDESAGGGRKRKDKKEQGKGKGKGNDRTYHSQQAQGTGLPSLSPRVEALRRLGVTHVAQLLDREPHAQGQGSEMPARPTLQRVGLTDTEIHQTLQIASRLPIPRIVGVEGQWKAATTRTKTTATAIATKDGVDVGGATMERRDDRVDGDAVDGVEVEGKRRLSVKVRVAWRGPRRGSGSGVGHTTPLNATHGRHRPHRAHAPFYPKARDEGGWLVVARVGTPLDTKRGMDISVVVGEVLALKRVTAGREASSHTLEVEVEEVVREEKEGEASGSTARLPASSSVMYGLDEIAFWFVSDTYVGLDSEMWCGVPVVGEVQVKTGEDTWR